MLSHVADTVQSYPQRMEFSLNREYIAGICYILFYAYNYMQLTRECFVAINPGSFGLWGFEMR